MAISIIELRTFIGISNTYVYNSNPFCFFFQMTNWYVIFSSTYKEILGKVQWPLLPYRMAPTIVDYQTCQKLVILTSFNHYEISDRPLWHHCNNRLRPQVTLRSHPYNLFCIYRVASSPTDLMREMIVTTLTTTKSRDNRTRTGITITKRRKMNLKWVSSVI